MSEDLTGHRFGRLTVIERVTPSKDGSIRYRCKCDCGGETIARARALNSGRTKSCGCLHREIVRNNNMTHGMTQAKPGESRQPRIYRIWANMKTRCSNPKTPYYKSYGGRGITVCPEWANDFQAFYDWAMAHGYDDGLQIDRIDNDGNYTPENCRWVTNEENANKKRNSLIIEYNGETHTAAEWAKITGISQKAIYTRHKAGKSPADILKK